MYGRTTDGEPLLPRRCEHQEVACAARDGAVGICQWRGQWLEMNLGDPRPKFGHWEHLTALCVRAAARQAPERASSIRR